MLLKTAATMVVISVVGAAVGMLLVYSASRQAASPAIADERALFDQLARIVR